MGVHLTGWPTDWVSNWLGVQLTETHFLQEQCPFLLQESCVNSGIEKAAISWDTNPI